MLETIQLLEPELESISWHLMRLCIWLQISFSSLLPYLYISFTISLFEYPVNQLLDWDSGIIQLQFSFIQFFPHIKLLLFQVLSFAVSISWSLQIKISSKGFVSLEVSVSST